MLSEEVYCVGVIPTTWTDKIWPEVESICDQYSNVIGDQYDLGTTAQVWASTTDEGKAYELYEKLIRLYPGLEENCEIITVHHILYWNNKLKNYIPIDPVFDHLMGHSDVARFLNWEKQQVTRYYRNSINGFPSPIKYEIGNRPIWLKYDIINFAKKYKPRNAPN